jgi:hypothetical protein
MNLDGRCEEPRGAKEYAVHARALQPENCAEHMGAPVPSALRLATRLLVAAMAALEFPSS